MTWEELLQGSANGLPKVQCSRAIGSNTALTGAIGDVTVIKDTEGYKGCAVRFTGIGYDTWFYADPGTDKRKHYMTELSFPSTGTKS